jgi:hypothetical protein
MRFFSKKNLRALALVVLIALFLGVIAFAFPARALELNYPFIPGFGDLDVIAQGNKTLTITQVVRLIYAATLWLSGLIAFGATLYAGFVFATSVENPAKRREAQERLAGVAFGILLLASSFLILRTINPELTTLRTSGFAICTDQGGFIECPKLAFQLLPSSPVVGKAPPPVAVYLAKNLFPGPPLDFTPENVLKITNDIDLDSTWDNKGQYIRMEGNGSVTLYDAHNYGTSPPWLRLAHHPSIGYTCVDGQYTSGEKIDSVEEITSCTNFFNNNQLPTLAGNFINLGQFCIDSPSCPPVGGDRFEDNISSIHFHRGEDAPSGCPVRGCTITRTFRAHLDAGDCGPNATEARGYPQGDPNYLGCGVDVVSSEGNAGGVYATMTGTVVTGYNEYAGYYAFIQNGDGTVRVKYIHLTPALEITNGPVSWGQLIGYQDTSGVAFGSHVHYAVHVDGKGVDPATYGLTPVQ